MKTRWFQLCTISVMVLACFLPTVEAQTQREQRLTLVGCVTASGAVGVTGPVHAVSVQSTGSASVVGLYNAAALGGATTANLTFEYGAPASDVRFLDFTDSPIEFTSGVIAVLSNVTAACAYRIQ